MQRGAGASLSVARRYDPDLLQKANQIFFRPLLDQLSFGDPMDGDRRHFQIVAGTRRTR